MANLIFSDLAKKHGPWSMSKAQLAVNCPHAFNLKYVNRVKGRPAHKNVKTRIGLAIHSVLEKYLGGTGTDAELRQAFQRAAVKQFLTTPEIEEFLGYTHNIIRFAERIKDFSEEHGVSKRFVEHQFALTIDMAPTKYWGKDVFFRGVWDLCLFAGRYIVIIDHKSGTIKNPRDALSRYGDQLRMYAIAARYLFPDTKGVQAAFHYAQSEEIIWGKMDNAEYIQEHYLPWYVKYINDAAACIPSKRVQKSWYCAFCDYALECPLRR